MRKSASHLLFFYGLYFAIIGTLNAGSAMCQESAAWDALIVGAKVYGTAFDAVAIRGTKIAQVGMASELEARCFAPCKKIQRKGGFLLPGLHDAHAHPESGGASEFRLNVRGSNRAEIAQALRQYSKANPDLPWVLGRGWDAAGFGDHPPTRGDLDKGESERPVALSDSDGHQLWTNSKAIELLGINKNSVDPLGGTIVRDSAGNPTGLFLENAADIVWGKIPPPPQEVTEKYVLKGQENAIHAGITSIHGGPVSVATAQTIRKLVDSGKYQARRFIWFDLGASDEEFLETQQFMQSLPRESRVQVTAYKGFVDGVISSYTAAMLAPYSDKPGVSGEPLLTQTELNRLVLRANQAGIPAALHAIGDRAVRMALDAFEFAQSQYPPSRDLYNRIEHIEVLDPSDAPRFGKLHVAASFQPAHMHFGSEASSYYPKRVGSRIAHVFPWRELQNGGALLVFGTDYPVVSQDPFEGIYCAIRRAYYDGTPFTAAQKLDSSTAVQGFTSQPALAIGREKSLGKIEVGYEADLIAVPFDPTSDRSKSLRSNAPTLVMVQGRVILE